MFVEGVHCGVILSVKQPACSDSSKGKKVQALHDCRQILEVVILVVAFVAEIDTRLSKQRDMLRENSGGDRGHKVAPTAAVVVRFRDFERGHKRPHGEGSGIHKVDTNFVRRQSGTNAGHC